MSKFWKFNQKSSKYFVQIPFYLKTIHTNRKLNRKMNENFKNCTQLKKCKHTKQFYLGQDTKRGNAFQ